MKLSLVSFDKSGVIKTAASGNITCSDFTGDQPNPLSGVLGQTWQNNNIVLDLSAVPYIDSSAVGWLISCQREVAKAGGSFIIHSVQPAVKQMLDLLKIGKVVSMTDDECSAKDLVTGGAR